MPIRALSYLESDWSSCTGPPSKGTLHVGRCGPEDLPERRCLKGDCYVRWFTMILFSGTSMRYRMRQYRLGLRKTIKHNESNVITRWYDCFQVLNPDGLVMAWRISADERRDGSERDGSCSTVRCGFEASKDSFDPCHWSVCRDRSGIDLYPPLKRTPGGVVTNQHGRSDSRFRLTCQDAEFIR